MKHAFIPVFTFMLTYFLLSFNTRAQNGPPDMRFGEVTPADFAPGAYAPDSSANAVFLFDHGEVSYDAGYNNRNGFAMEYVRHARIRILNKNALNLATLNISSAHHNGYEALITDVRGATFNLQDGKVLETKLDKKSIFKDKNGYYNIEKLAFPDAREGSIIEYSYSIIYPGYGYIPDWEFQGAYPVLWSQYEVTVPALFDYFVKNQGYRPYVIDTTLYSDASFPVSFTPYARGSWSGKTIHRIWALQDMPPLEKKEPYTTTLRNHIQKVQFQLSAVRYGDYNKTYRTTWPELSKELLQNGNFGGSLSDKNRWMDDELGKITTKDKVSREAAQKIFAWVRDQFTSTGQEGIYASQPLKKTWEDKKGSVADINLLLTAMYKHAGFEASAVILSTRTHGFTLDAFPLLNDYNYVITRVRADGQYYLLDASRTTTGFGELPELCYNGTAHAIDADNDAIPLLTDSVTERRTTQVTLANDEGGGFSGTYFRKSGVFESMDTRALLKREKPEDFFDRLTKGLAEYKQMGEHGFDSLGVPEELLCWHYSMTYHFTQKTLYFNPIMHERMNNSPIPDPERHYPVEMPYCIDNNYILHMDIPRGYAVEQLPKSMRFTLEDGSGSFEYRIDTDGKTIDFHTRLQLKRTNYTVAEYSGLHDFFALVVQKEKEPIIFKKTN